MPEIAPEIIKQFGDLFDRMEKLNLSYESQIKLGNEYNKLMEEQGDIGKKVMQGMIDASNDYTKIRIIGMKKERDELKSLSQQYDEFRKDLISKGGIIGAAGVAMPEQIIGFVPAMQKLKGSILSELPFGGLIGLMMYGLSRPEEVRAAGFSAMRMFQQAGNIGSEQFGRISGRVRALGIQLGMGPTGLHKVMAESARAMAQFGIDARDALEDNFRAPLQGVQESAMETAMRMDFFFKMGAGQAATNMGQMVRDYNVSLTESAELMASMGFAAQDAGTSVNAFTTSVLRSASAMRTQRIDIEEVANAQLKFQQIIQTTMPGVTQQFAAGYAERAIQQVTTGLAGLNEGMAAVMGERISAQMGRPVSGLEALYRFREGMVEIGAGDGGNGFFAESLQELIKFAQEQTGDEWEQRKLLQSLVSGLGTEGARALVDMGKDIKGGMTIQDAMVKHQGELEKSFKTQGQETSAFQRALLKAQDGIAKIGGGIFTVVTSGFNALTNYFKSFMTWMMFQGSAERDKVINQYLEQARLSEKGYRQGYDRVVSGLDDVWEAAKIAAGPGRSQMSRTEFGITALPRDVVDEETLKNLEFRTVGGTVGSMIPSQLKKGISGLPKFLENTALTILSPLLGAGKFMFDTLVLSDQDGNNYRAGLFFQKIENKANAVSEPRK